MKLTIKKASKQLDFSTEYEFILYLNEVYANGQFTSLKRLYLELNKEAKKTVLLNVDKEVQRYLIINT